MPPTRPANALYALCNSPTILNGKPESIPALSSSVLDGKRYFSASMLSTPNSWRFLTTIELLSVSCVESSYTGPIQRHNIVTSPSGISPSTPGGICCDLRHAIIKLLTCSSNALRASSYIFDSSGVAVSDSSRGFSIPAVAASVSRNRRSSW